MRILILLLCLFCAPMFAASKNVLTESVEDVSVYISPPGQPMDDFIKEVGPQLSKWTLENGVEACGYIAINQDTGQYSVVMGTIRSQLDCPMLSDRVLPGFTRTGESLHSHPRADDRGYIVVTERTRALSNSGLAHNERVPIGATNFSGADYALGPGYLVVAGGGVWHQQGRGTKRYLGRARSP